jgi:drug/metabolite transporter (DMT)-like permease
MGDNNADDRILVSYLTLRRVVGILGILLPVLLVVVSSLVHSRLEIQDSISDYYGTEMRDIFVGVLFVVGLFLFAYRGYERKDDIAGDLACLFALGVALFPSTSASQAIRTVHVISAAALFIVLSCFSLFLFTKTDKDVLPRKKRIRNVIYVICGVIMLACIVSIALYSVLLRNTSVAAIKPVFWLESLALWAFGISWLIKGETLLKDAQVNN